MPGLLRESLLLNKDFREILSFFCDEKVEFMLVGAYALAAHGLPRATGDIDLWIQRSPENAQRVWRALVNFGAPPGRSHVGGPAETRHRRPDWRRAKAHRYSN